MRLFTISLISGLALSPNPRPSRALAPKAPIPVASPTPEPEAVPFVSVEECIAEARKVTAAADTAIAALKSLTAAQQSENALLVSQLKSANELSAELLDRQNSWFRDPLTIGAMGIAAGLLGGIYLMRK